MDKGTYIDASKTKSQHERRRKGPKNRTEQYDTPPDRAGRYGKLETQI